MMPSADPGVELAARLRLACVAHDPTIAPHLERVTGYAVELGRRRRLDPARLRELRHAVPLHDLGKIGVPVALLSKPGRLNPAEMTAVMAHTLIGYRILEGSAWPVVQCAARIALAHHENWDGSGHPHGRAGEEIPLEARITAVADVYDALASPRAYKPAWEIDRVIEELRRLRGKKFDPDLLDLFLAQLPAAAGMPA
jgi:putative two-component system response regulator